MEIFRSKKSANKDFLDRGKLLKLYEEGIIDSDGEYKSGNHN